MTFIMFIINFSVNRALIARYLVDLYIIVHLDEGPFLDITRLFAYH